jgi:hypothetical protein
MVTLELTNLEGFRVTRRFETRLVTIENFRQTLHKNQWFVSTPLKIRAPGLDNFRGMRQSLPQHHDGASSQGVNVAECGCPASAAASLS